jgi:hypothetical protein
VRGRGRRAQPPAEVKANNQAQRGLLQRVLHSTVFVIAALVIGLVAIGYWSLTTLRDVSVGQLVPTPQQSEFLEQFAADSTLEPSPTFAPTSTPTPAAGPQILDRVILSIRVEQRTWTLIEVDGVVVFEGQAAPDTVLQYEGLQSIRVRTGNGAGLIVTYNGQALGPLGERGEVVERIFTPNKQITPTYTPTVTPTTTGVPTATPRSGEES